MARFEPDPTFIDAIKRGSEMKQLIEETTDQVTEEATRIARAEAFDESHDGDHYADSLETDVFLGADGYQGRTNAFDFKAHWIEFGTIKTAAKHVLSRALTAVLGTERVSRDK